jgi:hypothetical protein
MARHDKVYSNTVHCIHLDAKQSTKVRGYLAACLSRDSLSPSQNAVSLCNALPRSLVSLPLTLSFAIPDLNLVTNLLNAADNVLLNLVALSTSHPQNEVI